MKNKITLLFLSAVCFICMSCVDYVQTITYQKGTYQLYYKITLSKVLFELADEDPEEMFEVFDEEALSGLPANVYVNPVNTDLEVGAEFSVQVNPKTTDATEKSLLPTISGNMCYIPFLLGSDNNAIVNDFKSGDGEAEGLTKGILSSAKCRVMIDKSVIPAIEAAYFEGYGGQHYAAALFDYGNAYCIEIPFIILFETDMYRFDRIVVIKK
ncbi:MAG: hypothetical protein K6E51_07750 [Treponema sp.]|nr:hypothetical protein [Treponema sp.]